MDRSRVQIRAKRALQHGVIPKFEFRIASQKTRSVNLMG
jgi:hypothetical protein